MVSVLFGCDIRIRSQRKISRRMSTPAHWREETDEVEFVSGANTVSLARRSLWIVDNSSMNDWIVLVTPQCEVTSRSVNWWSGCVEIILMGLTHGGAHKKLPVTKTCVLSSADE
jgi:hypothetical protein